MKLVLDTKFDKRKDQQIKGWGYYWEGKRCLEERKDVKKENMHKDEAYIKKCYKIKTEIVKIERLKS